MDPERYMKITKSWETKDRVEIDEQKNRFIKEIKSGLGEQLRDVNSYKTKTPSKWTMIKRWLIKIWEAL